MRFLAKRLPCLLIGLATCLLAGGAQSTAATLPPGYVVPALPEIPPTHFTITDHGALGDGVTDNTRAVQVAIDAAKASGGGIVEVPAGVFLCGPLHLSDRIDLHLDSGATLKMLPLDRYPGGPDHPDNFINGSSLHDIAIRGPGTIDGQGALWWPFAKDKSAKRPRMIALSSCDRIVIEKVTLLNSPSFHIAIGGKSTHVTVRGVTIRANPSTDPVHPGHNTDACDVSAKHVLVEDCDVSVGDDDFTCGGGTSDVLITHCTYGYGHGVSIGSGTAGGVSNFTVDDCTFTNTEAGIRIKSDRDRGGSVHDIVYRNLRMTQVNFPILIYAAYMAPERQYRDLTNLTADIAAAYPSMPVAARTPLYRNITLSHITATASAGHRAGLIWGLPEAPIEGLVLDHVDITADKPFGLYFAQDVRLTNCHIATPAGLNKLSTTGARIEFSSP